MGRTRPTDRIGAAATGSRGRAARSAATVLLGSWFTMGGATASPLAPASASATSDAAPTTLRVARSTSRPAPPTDPWSYDGATVTERAWPVIARNADAVTPLRAAATGRG